MKMTRKNDGGPAFPPFPQPFAVRPGDDLVFRRDHGLQGMSVRQVYAGLIAGGWFASDKRLAPKDIAKYAFEIADALIAEGEKDD